MPINALLEKDLEDDDIIMQELLFGPPPRKIFEQKWQFQRIDLEYHLGMCCKKKASKQGITCQKLRS